ncbi:MAG: molybdenum cofactor guanylyltransferase [Nitrospiria bacterium]
MRRNQITGIVLAGGKGLRIGERKAFIELGGETLLNRAVTRLAEVFSEILVVVDDMERFEKLPYRCVTDRLPGLGPMGGIDTALRAASGDAVFVVACDMPFLKTNVIRAMTDLSDGYDLIIPSLPDGLHPLHALYTQGCLPAIEAQIKGGNLAPHSLPQYVRSRFFQKEAFLELDPLFRSVMNINTAADLEWGRRILEGKQP